MCRIDFLHRIRILQGLPRVHAVNEVNGHCRVNGAAIRDAGYEMHAAFAPATAADCVIQAAQGPAEVAVGSTSSFELRIVDTRKLACCFDGSEDVTALISGAALTTMPPEPRAACFHNFV